MDKRRSILNVAVSILSKILLLFAALIVRRLLIRFIGNEVNGLNALYTNILGILAIAELGIGSAIAYSMYRPIIAGEKKKVAALYGFYRRIYRIIAAVIFFAGLALMPFLPYLINDYESLNVNVYWTFLLTIISVVLSYLYSAKTSLLEAYKDNYITTGILTVSGLIRYGLQVAAILIWKSYIAFLVCLILDSCVAWFLTEIIARRKHREILEMHERVDPETKAEILRNVKAMFMHRIGNVLVNAVDGIIISGFIGITILGKYSNYTYIAGILAGILSLFFTPLVSVVGHFCAAGDPDRMNNTFVHFYCLNYILGFVFFLGYFAVIDSTVFLLFGSGLEMSRPVVFIITLNQFTQYMRNSLHLFRNASGTFYYDRWKPVAEGIMNLVLSLVFVHIFPEEYKVVGVIVATIITTFLICYTVEPYVVYMHVFGKSPKGFYIRNYAYTGLFICAMVVTSWIMQPGHSIATGILANGFLSVGLSAMVLGLLMAADKKFRSEIKFLAGKGISWAGKALRKES